jgi:mannose-6-phosphate isomerase
MSIEHARAHIVPKPWGVLDLHPWSHESTGGKTIGEVWFERSDHKARKTSLLLKLLFTNEPLSIQVHPGDAYAHSIGLPNGKTEAWHILSAEPGAKVALGLARRLDPEQLRNAIDTGSISDEVPWRAVSPGDTIFVPAGTIHAIGAGLVIAEIQQRSDTTFRLFDYGRQRELHVENAIAVADAGPAEFLTHPSRLTDQRTLLATSTQFVLERIQLPPNFVWNMDAEQETWLLVLNGEARAGQLNVVGGDVVFAQSDHVEIHAGKDGMKGLVARAGIDPAAINQQRGTIQ